MQYYKRERVYFEVQFLIFNTSNSRIQIETEALIQRIVLDNEKNSNYYASRGVIIYVDS